MLRLSLSAPMRLTNRLAPRMVAEKQGVIINIGCVAGLEPVMYCVQLAVFKDDHVIA
jgi:short-subunit dehydrogenase